MHHVSPVSDGPLLSSLVETILYSLRRRLRRAPSDNTHSLVTEEITDFWQELKAIEQNFDELADAEVCVDAGRSGGGIWQLCTSNGAGQRQLAVASRAYYPGG